MAIYTFTGASQATPTFDPATDTVFFQGVPASSVTNFTQSGSNVVVTTTTGTLTLTGTTLAALTNSNFLLSDGGAVRFGTTAAADTITGTAQGDILIGRTDNVNIDVINGGDGNNFVLGGSGVSDSVDGADNITTGSGNDRIYGNGGADSILGGTGNDQIFAGVGEDTIQSSVNGGQTGFFYGGGGGSDTTDAGDTIAITNAGTAYIYGNSGVDTITLTQTAGSASIFGGLGNDNLTVNGGSFGTVVVAGSQGADNINVGLAFTGSTTVYGGTGVSDATDLADAISVSGGSSLIYGNAGNDVINDSIDGGSSVYGGNGSDTINITFNNTNAKALVYGGTSDVGFTETIAIAAGNAGSSTIYGGAGGTDATDGADSITGGSGIDLIYGNAGDDTISGGAGGGNDSIFGGLGADGITVAGTGNVLVSGNEGADTFNFGTSLSSLDTVVGGTGTDILNFTDSTGGTGELFNVTGVETINAGAATTAVTTVDALVDAGASLTFNGALTTTTFNFNGAAETNGTFNVTGSTTGVSTIVTGAGADTITGGAGGGTYTGGAGADSMSAAVNAVADVFVVGNTDSGLSTSTADTITGFLAAADSINFGFNGSVGDPLTANYAEGAGATDFASALAAANTQLAALATGNTGNVEAASLQAVGANSFLFDDVDGNGTADQVVLLIGVTNLTFSETDLVA